VRYTRGGWGSLDRGWWGNALRTRLVTKRTALVANRAGCVGDGVFWETQGLGGGTHGQAGQMHGVCGEKHGLCAETDELGGSANVSLAGVRVKTQGVGAPGVIRG
jgi:hypothetical protein